jgi:hypothetical protein
MSHHIRGFIALRDNLARAVAGMLGAKVALLSLDFGFLPITDQLAGDEELAPFEHLERLTARLRAWAEEASANFPIAYVETDYFGGRGSQAAMAWIGGRLALGPIRTSDLQDGRVHATTPLLDRAINQALRLIGVKRGREQDEFDALGLGRHRSNDSWLSDSTG